MRHESPNAIPRARRLSSDARGRIISTAEGAVSFGVSAYIVRHPEVMLAVK